MKMTIRSRNHNDGTQSGGFYQGYAASSGAHLLYALLYLRLTFTIHQATEFIAAIELRRKRRKEKPKPKESHSKAFWDYCENVVYNTLRWAHQSLCTIIWPFSLPKQWQFKGPVNLWLPDDKYTPDFHGISQTFCRWALHRHRKKTRVIAHPMVAERWSSVLMSQTGTSPLIRYLTCQWYHDHALTPLKSDITWEPIHWDWDSWAEDHHPDPVLHSLSQTAVFLRLQKTKPHVADTWMPPDEWDLTLDAAPSVMPGKNASPQAILVGHEELCPNRLKELHRQYQAEKKGAQLW